MNVLLPCVARFNDVLGLCKLSNRFGKVTLQLDHLPVDQASGSYLTKKYVQADSIFNVQASHISIQIQLFDIFLDKEIFIQRDFHYNMEMFKKNITTEQKNLM